MTSSILFSEIQNFCIDNASEALVKKYTRYFKEGYNAYGLSPELLQSKVEDIVKVQLVDFATIIQTSHILIPTGKYEETSFAILLFKEFKRQFTPEIFYEIEKWFDEGINNWAHCDTICGDLISVLLEKKIITFHKMDKWRTSKNKFQRRAVPVALIKMLKYSNEYQPLFDFIDPMMMDEEREVHQGLGWFLREAWKKNPEQTEMYMMQWKDTAPRLIFQYATERMKPEQKQHFKRVRGSR